MTPTYIVVVLMHLKFHLALYDQPQKASEYENVEEQIWFAVV
jgi:hypothetical protein